MVDPNIIDSKGIVYLKNGFWQKQLLKLEDGRFQMSVFYTPTQPGKPAVEGRWIKTFFATHEVAKTIYDAVDSLAEAREHLDFQASK